MLQQKEITMSTLRRLEGKVAVITASTQGIGLAIAERLGREGASVVISSRKQANVDEAVSKLKALNIPVIGRVCHVAKPEHRRQLLEAAEKAFGGVDILVSNAAVNPYFGPMLQTSESVWDKIFETNVKATFFLIKETVPFMVKRGGGSIVMVSSTGGYTPNPYLGAYGVSKTTMLGMVKALVPELAANNIRVNGLAPGFVRTNFAAILESTKEAADEMMNRTPMAQNLGRFAEPKDMAGTVAYMVSDDALFLTGENIIVSGGIASRL